MKAKFISIGKGLSIAILCLGIIHEIATFTPLIQDGLERLSKSNFDAMIYMSLMCGASLVLNGLLLLLLLKKIETHSFFAYPILIISTFILISGVTAITFMIGNPFAWIVFALGLSITLIAIKLRRAALG